MRAILDGLSPLDLAALGWFLLVWCAYSLFVDRLRTDRGHLNAHMGVIRLDWMRTMVKRENRMLDGMLLGHLISSVSFFASTTVLLLAGLVGALAAVDQAYQVIMDIGFAQRTSRGLFELKLLLLIAILIYGFFKFTWSVRQFNYTVALVGATPLEAGEKAEQLAKSAAAMLSLAVIAFNKGLRAYYFAFATLGWLVHPGLFIALVTWVTAVLWRRQFASRAHAAVKDYVS